MITNLIPISEDDMYLEWARAEIPGRWRASAPAHLVATFDAGEELNDHERAESVAFMRTQRTEIHWFEERGRKVDWFLGDLPPSDVGDILLDGFWPATAYKDGWPEPIPRNVREFAEHPSAQTLTLQGPFRWGATRGRPILVGPDRSGPWLIAEGSNRLRGMWRARDAADAPAFVKVIAGTHADALSWKDSDMFYAVAAVRWNKGRTVRLAIKAETQVLFCIETMLSVSISEQCLKGFLRQNFDVAFNPPEWVWSPHT